MNKKHKIFLGIGLLALFAIVLVAIVGSHTVDVLSPAGDIAEKQRNLIYFALGLSLIVVIPVYYMTFAFAWKYRESNHKAKYSPNWDHSVVAESIWWLVPSILILILSVVTWNSSHDLDPFKAIKSDKQSMTIQVVALQWKWLFIYPEQNIATTNYVQFPEKTPITFEITADAPMNSFWIPQLGGQIYAMSGMSTHLNLIADQNRTYNGSSANISGRGFSSMNFTAKSSSQADFDAWVKQVKKSPDTLTLNSYRQLAQPSIPKQDGFYAGYQTGLYNAVLTKYMPYHQHVAEGHSMSEARL